jgi:hypothetical protein
MVFKPYLVYMMGGAGKGNWECGRWKERIWEDGKMRR